MNTKKRVTFFVVPLIILISLLALFSISTERTELKLADGKVATVHSPSLIASFLGQGYTLKVTSNNLCLGEARMSGLIILYRPGFILTGRGPDEIICVCGHETHLNLNAFDLHTRKRSVPGPLNFDVLSSDWEVRRLNTKEDLIFVITAVQGMSDKEFASRSIPSPNFGPFRFTTDREAMMEYLERQTNWISQP